ncbi:MAG: tetratricopeptide repeat protein [Planctomycetota bacterium]
MPSILPRRLDAFAACWLSLLLFAGCSDNSDETQPTPSPDNQRPAARSVSAAETEQATDLVKQAVEKAKSYDYADAIALYKQALEVDPNNDEAWRGSRLKPISKALAREAGRKAAAGGNHRFVGDVAKAFNEYRNAAKLDPNVESYQLQYAAAATALLRFEETQIIIDGMLARNPTKVPAILTGAEACYFSNDWEGCLKYLEDMTLIKDAAAKNGKLRDHLPNLLYMRAVAAHKAERLSTAIDSLRESLALQPNNLERQHYLGGVYLEEGHFDEAIGRFKSVLEKVPNHPNATVNVARALEKSGDIDAAIGWYEKAVKGSHRDWDMRISLARCYEKKGGKQSLLRADSNLQEAIQLNPRAHDAYFTLDRIHRKLGNKGVAARYKKIYDGIKEVINEQEDRLRLFATRVRKDPKDIEARLEMLEIHKEYHHNKDVKEIAMEILNVDPKQADALYYMAEATRVDGDFKSSYFQALKLMEAHPNDSRGFHMAAWALKDLGDDNGAFVLAKRGFEMDASNFGALEVMLHMMNKKGGYQAEITKYLPLYTELKKREQEKIAAIDAREKALEVRLLGALRQ